MVRVICLVLLSANVAVTEYDLLLLTVIFPVRENCALSAVELAAGFEGPFKSPVSKYLSFKLCKESTRVLLDWILFTVKVVGLGGNVAPLAYSNVWGKSVSSEKLTGWSSMALVVAELLESNMPL